MPVSFMSSRPLEVARAVNVVAAGVLLIFAALLPPCGPNAAAQSGGPRRLFTVCDNRGYGYIDAAGKVVIPLEFDMALDFSEGLAAVSVDDKFGFIDETGGLVIRPQFADARGFSEGLAAVNNDVFQDKWGYVDKSGRVVIPHQFKQAFDFSEGLAPVEVEREGGILRERAGARRPSLWGYVDRTGALAIRPRFAGVHPFKGGVAVFWTGESAGRNKYGLIDKTGREVVAPKFDVIGEDFRDGLAPFRAGGRWGFMDATGRAVVGARFDDAEGFSEGLGRVAVKNASKVLKWGFVDGGGRVVIAPQFAAAGDFSEGLAWVRTSGGKVGYIDRKGKLVVEPKFDIAKDFDGGLAAVAVLDSKKFVYRYGAEWPEMEFGYIDKSGRYVWKLTYPDF